MKLQTKQYQKAASAAFTYLVSHPDDRIIQTALKQYAQMENVDMKAITNYVAEVTVQQFEKRSLRAFINTFFPFSDRIMFTCTFTALIATRRRIGGRSSSIWTSRWSLIGARRSSAGRSVKDLSIRDGIPTLFPPFRVITPDSRTCRPYFDVFSMFRSFHVLSQMQTEMCA